MMFNPKICFLSSKQTNLSSIHDKLADNLHDSCKSVALICNINTSLLRDEVMAGYKLLSYHYTYSKPVSSAIDFMKLWKWKWLLLLYYDRESGEKVLSPHVLTKDFITMVITFVLLLGKLYCRVFRMFVCWMLVLMNSCGQRLISNGRQSLLGIWQTKIAFNPVCPSMMHVYHQLFFNLLLLLILHQIVTFSWQTIGFIWKLLKAGSQLQSVTASFSFDPMGRLPLTFYPDSRPFWSRLFCTSECRLSNLSGVILRNLENKIHGLLPTID